MRSLTSLNEKWAKCWTRWRKENRNKQGHSANESWRRDFDWSKVKVSDLHLLWFNVKSVEGRKEGKDEEINREAIQPMKMEKEVKSQSVRTRCSLEELREWEQAKEKRKIERIRENTRWGRKQWVKRKREFFLYSSQSVVISI